MGFSIVPHLWLPEKIFTDCVKCPLFRQCGQYAMVAAARRRVRRASAATAAGAPRRRVAHDRADSSTRPIDRRRRHRRRAASAPPASAPASRPNGERSTSRCSSSDAPGHGRRPSSPPTRPGGAGRRVAASTWRDPAASPAPSSSTAAAPTPAPATTGMRGRARHGRARPRALVGCPAEQVLVASTGVIGVALPIDKIRARHRRARSRRSAPISGAAAARAIMTTDPFPKEAAARVDDRRPRRHDRRHGQGLRHDRADDGDDARRS